MNRLMRYFEFKHLSLGPLRQTSIRCSDLAREMDESLEESAEKTAGLRKLLEAKDCFVRAKLDEIHAQSSPPPHSKDCT